MSVRAEEHTVDNEKPLDPAEVQANLWSVSLHNLSRYDNIDMSAKESERDPVQFCFVVNPQKSKLTFL